MTDTIETMPKKRRRTKTDLRGSNRLPIIEAQIKIEHDAYLSAVRTSIDHAIKAGTLLEEAKGLLRHGQWLPWLSDHCGLSDRTAQRYMRLARNAKSATMADLGIAAADRLLGFLAEWDNDEQHDAHVRNWLERHRDDQQQQEKEPEDDTGDEDAELFAALRDKAEPNLLGDEDAHPLLAAFLAGDNVAARAYFAREAAHDARRVIARAEKEEKERIEQEEKARADQQQEKERGDTGDKAAAHDPDHEQHDAHVRNWLERHKIGLEKLLGKHSYKWISGHDHEPLFAFLTKEARRMEEWKQILDYKESYVHCDPDDLAIADRFINAAQAIREYIKPCGGSYGYQLVLPL